MGGRRAWSGLLGYACFVAALGAGLAAAPSAGGPGTATPIGTPAVEVWARSGSGPFPPGCRPDEVARLVMGFLDAYNHGDQGMLAGFFPGERADPGAAKPGFQWYSVPTPDGHFVAREPAELSEHFAARHARHERFQLLQLEVATSWHPGVDIVFNLRRRADDFPERVVGGKGAIDCEDRTIIVWSLGDAEALTDTQATPASR